MKWSLRTGGECSTSTIHWRKGVECSGHPKNGLLRGSALPISGFPHSNHKVDKHITKSTLNAIQLLLCYSLIPPIKKKLKRCSTTSRANSRALLLFLLHLHIVIYSTPQSLWAVYRPDCRPNRNSIVYTDSPAVQWPLSVMPSPIRSPFIGRNLSTCSNVLLISFHPLPQHATECRTYLSPFVYSLHLLSHFLPKRKKKHRIEKNKPPSFLNGSCATKKKENVVFPSLPLLSLVYTHTKFRQSSGSSGLFYAAASTQRHSRSHQVDLTETHPVHNNKIE